MPFLFQRLEIPDVILIQARAFDDRRGFFMETYKHSEFASNNIPEAFAQGNFSHSVQGVLRGLHYQLLPKAQGKLVSVTHGSIFDVAVDMRRGSPTYGRWVGVTLSAADHRLVYVPVGFAHGFGVLSEQADVVYEVTEEYAPELDRGIRWNDPDLGIPWPLQDPVVSLRDSQWPRLRDAENNFAYASARP